MLTNDEWISGEYEIAVPAKRRITITIREVSGARRVWGPSTHRQETISDAIGVAVRKHFGKKHGFFIDSGLTNYPDSTRYGQVGHSVGNGSSMDTGRVRIDIEED